MLTFGDNLKRALESVPAAARAEADNALKSFVEGIELTERDFVSRLSRHGVRKLEPKGQKFDPHFHEALLWISGRKHGPRLRSAVVEEEVMLSGMACCARPRSASPKAAPNPTETPAPQTRSAPL